MPVKTYNPRAKVQIQTYKGDDFEDITKGIASIQLNKNLYQPAGTFDIELLPIRDQNGASYYYRISPMDHVTVSFTRTPSKFTTMPPVMRGFVDNVNMSAQVDHKGAPDRRYSFVGRDYGKLYQITAIYYLVFDKWNMMPNKLMEKYKIPFAGKATDILKSMHEVTLEQLENVKKTYSKMESIEYLPSTNIEGKIHTFSSQQWDRDVWGLMQHYDNAPWNELYLLDLEKPTLIFRKTPWLDEEGKLIQGEDSTYEKTLKYIDITPGDIKSFTLSRSDSEVRNYYFTYPTLARLGDQATKDMALLGAGNDPKKIKGNPYITDEDEEYGGRYRYGFRNYDYASEFFDYEQGMKEEDQEKAQKGYLKDCETLNKNLAAAFKYNSAFENGIFTIKGNEEIQPGHYIKWQEGLFYVTNVRHSLNFIPGQEQFTTTLSVVRGTNYLSIKKKLDEKKQGSEINQVNRVRYGRAVTGRY